MGENRAKMIESSELCPSCGEIPLVGDVGEEVECPICGEVVTISD
jgi:uncharacterized Zn finger protein (UPF0148 family)